jgi:hypothetical protein
MYPNFSIHELVKMPKEEVFYFPEGQLRRKAYEAFHQSGEGHSSFLCAFT